MTFKIYYDVNGGSQLLESVLICKYNQEYKLALPTRIGYTFEGWYYENEKFNNGIWTGLSDIILVAKWSVIDYSIVYNLNGGICDIKLIDKYNYESDDIIVTKPTKKGYTFVGWKVNDLSDLISNYTIKHNSTGNIELIAIYEINTYTITLDVNGGDPLLEDKISVTYDSPFELVVPSRKGYQFEGWYYNTEKVSFGIWQNDYSITVKAKWIIINYNISYDLNGGKNNSNNVTSYNYESNDIKIYYPLKTGYTFIGWIMNDNSDLVMDYVIKHNSTNDLKLKAYYKVNTYKVLLDVNGGNELSENEYSIDYDSEFNLVVPERNGYNFEGWYLNENKINSGKWTIDGNVTLRAKWKIIKYNIIYVLDEGINNSLNPLSYTYDDETIILKEPNKIGYAFIGWVQNKLEVPNKNVSILHNSIGDKTYYAKWKANNYNITYDVNGGNKLTNNIQTVTYDKEVNLLIPSKTGYKFIGWYNNDVEIKSGVWKINSNITLKAKWEAKKYTIIKHIGTFTEKAVVTYDEMYNLGTPNKNYYTFVGYYTKEYGEGIKYTDQYGNSINRYTDAKDIDLYALFTYTLSFVTNGGNNVPSITLKENESFDNSIICKKENRSFAGWYKDTQLTNIVSNEPLKTMTLYAKWEEEVIPYFLKYSLSNNSVTITGSTFTGDKLIIPTHIGGYEVKTIGSRAFSGMKLIKEVYIPETVTEIGNSAFYGCSKLETITIPFVGMKQETTNSSTALFGYIFGGSDGVYQHYQLSTGKDETIKYSIPTTIQKVNVTVQTEIPYGAFSGCTFIKEIKIPESVKEIGAYAFYNCNSIYKLNSEEEGVLNIPKAVINISDYSFYQCQSIEVVTMGNELTNIGAYAFYGCSSVVKFNTEKVNSLVVPNGCQTIGSRAFSGMKLIKEVYIPETVTEIGNSAFYGCSKLETITIPFVGMKQETTNSSTALFGYIFGGSDGVYQHYQLSTGKDETIKYSIPTTIQKVNVTVQTEIPYGAFSGCTFIKEINVLVNADLTSEKCLYNCGAVVNKVLQEYPYVPWDGKKVSNILNKGLGTSNSPYLIENGADLAYIAEKVNSGVSFEGVYFKLTRNINLNQHGLVIGIDASHPFKGIINGCGYKIENYKLETKNAYAGIFGYFEGTIDNIGFENLYLYSDCVDEKLYVGIFAYVGANAHISNIYASGKIVGQGKNITYVGGIAGYSNGIIENSYSAVDVYSISLEYIAYAGGVVGYLEYGKINNSLTIGKVSAKGATTPYSRNGGLVGFSSVNAIINNSYRSLSQILIRYNNSNSSYNEIGETIDVTSMRAFEIINKLLWDTNIWSYNYKTPKLGKAAI